MTNDWTPTSLSEILTLERRPVKLDPEKEYSEIGIYSYGRGIFHKRPRTGFEVGDKDLFLIKNGDFIFQITFAWEGAVGLASELEDGMYGSVRFPTHRVNEEICYPKFLVNYFKTHDGRNQLVKISPGSAGRNRVLSTKRLPEILVPLPSLEEQHRIVEHVEALANRIEEAQSLREEADIEADRFLDSCLLHLFEKNTAPKKSLRDISHFQRGRFSWRPRNEPRFYGGNYPFIQIGDIPRDKKHITSHTQTLNDDGLKISRMFPAGTIVLSIAATIGAVGILDFDSCMPDSLVGLNVRPEMAVSDYLFYFLKYSQSHFENIAPQSAQKNINIGILEEVRLPVPSLDEQRRIVAYLDSVQARLASLRELQSATGEELSALLPSALDRAFKGEL